MEQRQLNFFAGFRAHKERRAAQAELSRADGGDGLPADWLEPLDGDDVRVVPLLWNPDGEDPDGEYDGDAGGSDEDDDPEAVAESAWAGADDGGAAHAEEEAQGQLQPQESAQAGAVVVAAGQYKA